MPKKFEGCIIRPSLLIYVPGRCLGKKQMEAMLGQRWVEVFGVVSLDHHQMGCLMMIGLRMGRSGEIGWVNGLMIVYVYQRDELEKVGLGYGEMINGCLD